MKVNGNITIITKLALGNFLTKILECANYCSMNVISVRFKNIYWICISIIRRFNQNETWLWENIDNH